VSAVPLTETAAKRRIGDILLAHGFVTQEQLALATEEQERTQQPLGQILVGHGAITRLELASALAEQWSDPAASISSSSRSAPAPVPVPTAQDEAQYAARLQEAVADLARKVQSNKPLEGIDERVEELSRRIESTLARTQHIEAAVATLAESLEGVTTGVEEAFYALQTGTAELAADMSRLEQAVAEISSREAPSGDTQSQELEALRSAVAELLESRPSADLAERLDRLEAASADEELRASVNGQAALLDDLRLVVRELQQRPEGASEVDERLARIEQHLEAAASSHADLSTRVDLLGERAPEPAVDPRLDAVLAELSSVESRLEATVAVVDEVKTAVDAQGGASLERRLHDLASEVAALRQEALDAAAAAEPVRRTMELVEDLRADIERLDSENGEGRAVATRLDELTASLADRFVTPDMLAVALEETSSDGAGEELIARLGALEARLADGIVTPDALTKSIEWAMSERRPVEDDERMEGLRAEIGALRAEVASLAENGREPGLDPRVADIEARVEELANARAAEAELASRLSDLEQARSGDLDTVDVLARAMDRIRHDLTSEPEVSESATAETTAAVAELSQRIAALEESSGAEPADQSESATAETTAAVAELSQRIAALEESRGAEPADQSESATAETTAAVAELSQRIAALEESRGAEPADQSELAAEFGRLRLMLERIGLHLGEHDRALADLAPSREVEERLQELAALAGELAASQHGERTAQPRAGAAMPLPGDIGALLRRVEEAETASQSDAEKLMNRLEKMASSIDWRLQRLESDEAEPAE